DIEKLKEDSKSIKTNKALAENRELANSLGISGTPAFIIENEVVRGYVPYEAMQETIDGLRAGKED
ncbi:MAG: DsbA family protein, partial [Bdellovibrionales bacterium]